MAGAKSTKGITLVPVMMSYRFRKIQCSLYVNHLWPVVFRAFELEDTHSIVLIVRCHYYYYVVGILHQGRVDRKGRM